MRASDGRGRQPWRQAIAIAAAASLIAAGALAQAPASTAPRAIADAFARLPIDGSALAPGYRIRERLRLESELAPFGRLPTVGFKFDGPRGTIDAGALLFPSPAAADRYLADLPRLFVDSYRVAAWTVTTPVALPGGPEATCVTAARSSELICVLGDPGSGATALTVVMTPPALDQFALAFLRDEAARQHAGEVMAAVLPTVRGHLARARAAAGTPISGRPPPPSDAAGRAAIDSAIRLFRETPQPTSPARPSALYRRDYPAAREGQPGRTIGWMKDAAEPATAAAIATKQPLVLVIVDGRGASHRMVSDILPCPAINAFAGKAIFAIADVATDEHARSEVARVKLKDDDLPAVVVHVHARGKLDASWLLEIDEAGPLAAEIARVLRIPVPMPPALPALGRYGPLRPGACGS